VTRSGGSRSLAALGMTRGGEGLGMTETGEGLGMTKRAKDYREERRSMTGL